MSYVVRIGHCIFRIAAVLGVAAKLCFCAAGLLSREAIYALSAGGVQPDDAGTVAFLCCLDVPANAGDVPNTLVSRNKGRRRLNGPIPFRSVQIGMTYAACLHLDLNFIRTRFWDCHLFDDQGLTKFTNYSRLHILRHFVFPFCRVKCIIARDGEDFCSACGACGGWKSASAGIATSKQQSLVPNTFCT